jgi:hypothetical protein
MVVAVVTNPTYSRPRQLLNIIVAGSETPS